MRSPGQINALVDALTSRMIFPNRQKEVRGNHWRVVIAILNEEGDRDGAR